MKKAFFTITMCIFALAASISCSNDNEVPEVDLRSKLVGKWDLKGEYALDANGKVVSTDYEGSECPPDLFEFLASGKLTQQNYEHSEKENGCKPTLVNGNWKIEGETFKYNSDYTESEQSFTIKKLDGNTFEIQRPVPKEFAEEYELNVVSLKTIFERVK